MWDTWSSDSPGRVAGRADGVTPASESSSASVADALLAGQLFLLETHNYKIMFTQKYFLWFDRSPK